MVTQLRSVATQLLTENLPETTLGEILFQDPHPLQSSTPPPPINHFLLNWQGNEDFWTLGRLQSLESLLYHHPTSQFTYLTSCPKEHAQPSLAVQKYIKLGYKITQVSIYDIIPVEDLSNHLNSGPIQLNRSLSHSSIKLNRTLVQSQSQATNCPPISQSVFLTAQLQYLYQRGGVLWDLHYVGSEEVRSHQVRAHYLFFLSLFSFYFMCLSIFLVSLTLFDR